MKYLSILCLAILCSSCTYLAQHPQVESDLKQEGVDVAKDTEKVVEDIIDAAPNTTQPASPTVMP